MIPLIFWHIFLEWAIDLQELWIKRTRSTTAKLKILEDGYRLKFYDIKTNDAETLTMWPSKDSNFENLFLIKESKEIQKGPLNWSIFRRENRIQTVNWRIHKKEFGGKKVYFFIFSMINYKIRDKTS